MATLVTGGTKERAETMAWSPVVRLGGSQVVQAINASRLDSLLIICSAWPTPPSFKPAKTGARLETPRVTRQSDDPACATCIEAASVKGKVAAVNINIDVPKTWLGRFSVSTRHQNSRTGRQQSDQFHRHVALLLRCFLYVWGAWYRDQW
jgi:hypothetical protein